MAGNRQCNWGSIQWQWLKAQSLLGPTADAKYAVDITGTAPDVTVRDNTSTLSHVKSSQTSNSTYITCTEVNNAWHNEHILKALPQHDPS